MKSLYALFLSFVVLFLTGCASPILQDNTTIHEPAPDGIAMLGQGNTLADVVQTYPHYTRPPPAALALSPPFQPLRELHLPAHPTFIVVPKPELDAKEVNCMARAIYFEARSEPLAGQYAVGYVVLNRLADSRFPNTICGIVTQGPTNKAGKPLLNRCQFSWHCQSRPAVVKKPDLFAKITEMAKAIMRAEVRNPIGKNLFFHATYVNLKHRRQVVGRQIIGNHVFYAYLERRVRLT